MICPQHFLNCYNAFHRSYMTNKDGESQSLSLCYGTKSNVFRIWKHRSHAVFNRSLYSLSYAKNYSEKKVFCFKQIKLSQEHQFFGIEI